MKKYLGIVVVGVLLISFQNCRQVNCDPNGKNCEAAAGKPQQEIQYEKTKVEGFTKLVVWDYQRNQFLDLDLKTGELTAFEQAGSVRGSKYCLNSTDTKRVNEILIGSEICKPLDNLSSNPETVCAQVYKYPYASLVNSRDEIHLGEKTDGCQIPTDLCGSKAQELLQFTTGIVVNLDKLVCK